MVNLYHPTSPSGKMARYGWLACHLMQQMQHLRWRFVVAWLENHRFLVRRYIWTSSKMIRIFHCHVSFPEVYLLDNCWIRCFQVDFLQAAALHQTLTLEEAEVRPESYFPCGSKGVV